MGDCCENYTKYNGYTSFLLLLVRHLLLLAWHLFLVAFCEGYPIFERRIEGKVFVRGPCCMV